MALSPLRGVFPNLRRSVIFTISKNVFRMFFYDIGISGLSRTVTIDGALMYLTYAMVLLIVHGMATTKMLQCAVLVSIVFVTTASHF